MIELLLDADSIDKRMYVFVNLHISRFHDGNIIQYSDEAPFNSNTLHLSPAVEGKYQCRVTSYNVKRFSTTATVTVKG